MSDDTNTGSTTSDELTTADGRKIINFSAAGESYSIESTEQAAKGETAEVETEIQKIKLRAMQRGIRHIRL